MKVLNDFLLRKLILAQQVIILISYMFTTDSVLDNGIFVPFMSRLEGVYETTISCSCAIPTCLTEYVTLLVQKLDGFIFADQWQVAADATKSNVHSISCDKICDKIIFMKSALVYPL